MSKEAAAAGAEGGGEEDPIAAAELACAELLRACEDNDTETAIRLIEEQGADPCHEDRGQWSPLVWAASHGNEELTRFLISRGAADPYRPCKLRGHTRRKKHSPLHWAAFKGHNRILWLLMAPPCSLPHNERDAIGNTPLHQAAAGGWLECAETLMSRGVDCLARNDRGHTPFQLCTVPEVQSVLQNAQNTTMCRVTHKQFSSNVLRYLCLWSGEVFAQEAIVQTVVYQSQHAEEKLKPVTWSLEVKLMIDEAEQGLRHSLQVNQLEVYRQAIGAASDKPVDCKLIWQCIQARDRLESEAELGKAMQVDTITSVDEFSNVHEALSKAIDDAERKSADPARVSWAKALRRKQMAEVSLMRAIQGPQKVLTSHINMLEELTKAAEAERANEDLLSKAEKLVIKLKSEQEVERCFADTEPLIEDPARKENLPPWCHDTKNFEQFHEDYKSAMERAERGAISPTLMTKALGQLAALEQMLVERKLREAEQQLKDAKKKPAKGARF